MNKIVFIPDHNQYIIKYIDDDGNPKYLGKVRHDLLQTAMWFYRLEGIDIEIVSNDASISS